MLFQHTPGTLAIFSIVKDQWHEAGFRRLLSDACEPPTELIPHSVGVEGLEPPTFSMSRRRTKPTVLNAYVVGRVGFEPYDFLVVTQAV